jgi:Fic family protein
MTNILTGGVYRNTAVRITGAAHKPPVPSEMYRQIKAFFADLPMKAYNAVELAAYTHAEFVKIHPFEDGNGRTSRLLMNYQLMSNGFLPIAIKKAQRLEYFGTLEAYAVDDDLEPFTEMIAKLVEERLLEYLAI